MTATKPNRPAARFIRKPDPESSDPLVGLRFFSYDRETGKRMWQGQVIAPVPGGFYLVELYDWLAGQPSSMVLVTIDEMTYWSFFDDDYVDNNSLLKCGLDTGPRSR